MIMSRPPAATIALGPPQNWACRQVLDDTGEVMSSGIAKTEHPDVAVIETMRGKKAFCSRCPHRGRDLTVHGRIDEKSGEIRCIHNDYAWSAETGEAIRIGFTGNAGPIKLHDIAFDEDGVAYSSVEVGK